MGWLCKGPYFCVTIECENSYLDQGVAINDILSWDDFVNTIVLKANKMPGFIRTWVGCDVQMKVNKNYIIPV